MSPFEQRNFGCIETLKTVTMQLIIDAFQTCCDSQQKLELHFITFELHRVFWAYDTQILVPPCQVGTPDLSFSYYLHICC